MAMAFAGGGGGGGGEKKGLLLTEHNLTRFTAGAIMSSPYRNVKNPFGAPLSLGAQWCLRIQEADKILLRLINRFQTPDFRPTTRCLKLVQTEEEVTSSAADVAQHFREFNSFSLSLKRKAARVQAVIIGFPDGRVVCYLIEAITKKKTVFWLEVLPVNVVHALLDPEKRCLTFHDGMNEILHPETFCVDGKEEAEPRPLDVNVGRINERLFQDLHFPWINPDDRRPMPWHEGSLSQVLFGTDFTSQGFTNTVS